MIAIAAERGHGEALGCVRMSDHDDVRTVSSSLLLIMTRLADEVKYDEGREGLLDRRGSAPKDVGQMKGVVSCLSQRRRLTPIHRPNN